MDPTARADLLCAYCDTIARAREARREQSEARSLGCYLTEERQRLLASDLEWEALKLRNQLRAALPNKTTRARTTIRKVSAGPDPAAGNGAWLGWQDTGGEG